MTEKNEECGADRKLVRSRSAGRCFDDTDQLCHAMYQQESNLLVRGLEPFSTPWDDRRPHMLVSPSCHGKSLKMYRSFFRRLAPMGRIPRPVSLISGSSLTAASMSSWHDGINQKLLRLWLMCARLSELSALSTSRAVSATYASRRCAAQRAVYWSLSRSTLAPPPAKVHRWLQTWRAARESHPIDRTG